MHLSGWGGLDQKRGGGRGQIRPKAKGGGGKLDQKRVCVCVWGGVDL